MPIPSDTSRDAEEVQLRLMRAMTFSEKWALVCRLSYDVMQASKRAIRRAHPEFSEIEVGQTFVEIHYGKELADELRRHQRTLGNE